MTTDNTTNIELSVIIPVSERHDPIKELYSTYKEDISAIGKKHEIIFVVDGYNPQALADLKELQKSEPIKVLTLPRRFGETTALNAAIDESSGEIILTLPAYQQVESGKLNELVQALMHNDVVLARRWPRYDSAFNRLQAKAFNALLRTFTDLKTHDAGCGVRAFKKYILDDIQLYGDMLRFLPLMATRQGFSVAEIDIPQSKKDAYQRIHPIGIYVRRLLDILTVLFLAKFIKKPLRFFGLIGITLMSTGAFITAYLIIERLFFEVALSDRPALFLGSLLIVLGVQVIAIGLIGEILVFTHAKDMKEYRVKKIIN